MDLYLANDSEASLTLEDEAEHQVPIASNLQNELKVIGIEWQCLQLRKVTFKAQRKWVWDKILTYPNQCSRQAAGKAAGT